jgi:hypothetical protein
MSDQITNAAAEEELNDLRAEVARLRRALELQRGRSYEWSRSPLELDPDAPGLAALWRGERGLGWQLFVQAVVAINAVLAVAAGVAIVH